MKMKAIKIVTIIFGYTMLVALMLLAEVGLGTIIEFYTGIQCESSWPFVVEYATAHSWYIPVCIGLIILGCGGILFATWPWIKKKT